VIDACLRERGGRTNRSSAAGGGRSNSTKQLTPLAGGASWDNSKTWLCEHTEAHFKGVLVQKGGGTNRKNTPEPFTHVISIEIRWFEGKERGRLLRKKKDRCSGERKYQKGKRTGPGSGGGKGFLRRQESPIVQLE